jgi:NAD(P)-dependent dehydrogenase (short-subunit alcohol dehydrogenase family)
MGALLKDRVAVVTGAGNGLGRAEAKGLAAQGAAVVVNDVGAEVSGKGTSKTPADLVVEDILRSGGRAVANYDSVATEEGANRIIKTALDNFGRIDVLVNNAGFVRAQAVYDIVTEDWDAVIKVHLYGTMYCTRAATAVMKKQGYGRIVNTSSHTGLGVMGLSAYSSAKEGITGFTRTVARDMADYGVNCNAIRPIAAFRGIPNQREAIEVNKPEDTAALVVYLASEAAANINGCIFEVWRGHVGIYADPPPVEHSLWKDGRWTPEELAKTMPLTITKDKKRSPLPLVLPFDEPRPDKK